MRKKNKKMSGGQKLVSEIYSDLKSHGFLERLRLEAIADVKKKDSYQQLMGRIREFLTKKLSNGEWRDDEPIVETDVFREKVVECGVLAITVERIVDEVVSRTLQEHIRPMIEEIVRQCCKKQILEKLKATDIANRKEGETPDKLLVQETENIVKKICDSTESCTETLFRDGFIANSLASLSKSANHDSESNSDSSDDSYHPSLERPKTKSPKKSHKSPEKGKATPVVVQKRGRGRPRKIVNQVQGGETTKTNAPVSLKKEDTKQTRKRGESSDSDVSCPRRPVRKRMKHEAQRPVTKESVVVLQDIKGLKKDNSSNGGSDILPIPKRSGKKQAKSKKEEYSSDSGSVIVDVLHVPKSSEKKKAKLKKEGSSDSDSDYVPDKPYTKKKPVAKIAKKAQDSPVSSDSDTPHLRKTKPKSSQKKKARDPSESSDTNASYVLTKSKSPIKKKAQQLSESSDSDASYVQKTKPKSPQKKKGGIVSDSDISYTAEKKVLPQKEGDSQHSVSRVRRERKLNPKYSDLYDTVYKPENNATMSSVTVNVEVNGDVRIVPPPKAMNLSHDFNHRDLQKNTKGEKAVQHNIQKSKNQKLINYESNSKRERQKENDKNSNIDVDINNKLHEPDFQLTVKKYKPDITKNEMSKNVKVDKLNKSDSTTTKENHVNGVDADNVRKSGRPRKVNSLIYWEPDDVPRIKSSDAAKYGPREALKPKRDQIALKVKEHQTLQEDIRMFAVKSVPVPIDHHKYIPDSHMDSPA